MKLKIIIPLSQVPEGRKVTKRTGEKIYTVRNELRVYADRPEDRAVVTAKNGTTFLVADNGNAEAVVSTTEVLWFCTLEDLYASFGVEEDK